jgi:uncharacterized protein
LQRVTRERRRSVPVGDPVDGPVRTCVGCRQRRARSELVRLARTPEGVRYDRQRRASGRGANLCPDLSCIEAASERGAGRLRRALRGAPEAQIHAALDTLRREITENEPSQAPVEGAVRSSRT